MKKMKMKNIYYSIIIILILSGCNKIDNYDAPNATLTGKVVDNVTNEMIENAGVNSGTRIQLFEDNSKQPILSNSFPDGHFVNAALFPGNYKLFPLGAFRIVGDTVRLTISGVTNTEVRVLPNVRLKTTVLSINGTTGTIKVKYTKVHTDETLTQLGLVWSTIDNPNITTFFGGAKKIDAVASQNLTAGEKTYTITGLTVGTRYFFRAAAATNNPGNYYNYSSTIKTQ